MRRRASVQPPRTPPQCLSSNSCNGTPMASSTVQGFSPGPKCRIVSVPVLFGRPDAGEPVGRRAEDVRHPASTRHC